MNADTKTIKKLENAINEISSELSDWKICSHQLARAIEDIKNSYGITNANLINAALAGYTNLCSKRITNQNKA